MSEIKVCKEGVGEIVLMEQPIGRNVYNVGDWAWQECDNRGDTWHEKSNDPLSEHSFA